MKGRLDDARVRGGVSGAKVCSVWCVPYRWVDGRRTWPRACGAKAIAEQLKPQNRRLDMHTLQAAQGSLRGAPALARVAMRRPLAHARLAWTAGARRARPAPSRRQVTATAQVGFDIVGAVDADAFQSIFFTTVAATVVGFAGTFFVLPQYADQVKEAKPWKEVFLSLQASGLPSRTPKQVQAAQQDEGYASHREIKTPTRYPRGGCGASKTQVSEQRERGGTRWYCRAAIFEIRARLYCTLLYHTPARSVAEANPGDRVKEGRSHGRRLPKLT